MKKNDIFEPSTDGNFYLEANIMAELKERGKRIIQPWLDIIDDEQFLELWSKLPDDSYHKQIGAFMSLLQCGQSGEGIWQSVDHDKICASHHFNLNQLRYLLAVHAHNLAKAKEIARQSSADS